MNFPAQESTSEENGCANGDWATDCATVVLAELTSNEKTAPLKLAIRTALWRLCSDFSLWIIMIVPYTFMLELVLCDAFLVVDGDRMPLIVVSYDDDQL